MAAAIVALVLQGPALTARLFAYCRGRSPPRRRAAARPPRWPTGAGVLARALAVRAGGAALAAAAAACCRRAGCSRSGRCARIWRGCRPPPGSGACSAVRRRWQVGKRLLKVVIVAAAGLADACGRCSAGWRRWPGAPSRALRRRSACLPAQLAERVALAALALGVADYLLSRRAAHGPPADDPRRGQARAQGIGGRSRPPGRAPAASPRAFGATNGRGGPKSGLRRGQPGSHRRRAPLRPRGRGCAGRRRARRAPARRSGSSRSRARRASRSSAM